MTDQAFDPSPLRFSEAGEAYDQDTAPNSSPTRNPQLGTRYFLPPHCPLLSVAKSRLAGVHFLLSFAASYSLNSSSPGG